MPALTVIYVAYGIDRLDLEWLPSDVPVLVVHNDDRLPAPDRHGAISLHPKANVGFGAGVNLALAEVQTPRVLLCNPDTKLTLAHYEALRDAPPADLATIPLVEPDGTPNSVINGYWHPASYVASALRLGRLAPRGSVRRRVLTRMLGQWGSAHRDSFVAEPSSWPLDQRWASAAVLVAPTEQIKEVGGFDEDYFLYYEDADLQRRLAERFPTMRVHLLAVTPGVHEVGGSDHGSDSPVVRHRLASALTYGRRQTGLSWRLATRIVAVGGSS